MAREVGLRRKAQGFTTMPIRLGPKPTRTGLCRLALAAVVACVGLLAPAAAHAADGATIHVSVRTDGTQATGAAGSAAVSRTGRHVAFVSNAADLVDNDGNGQTDVFRRDLDTGETVLVSVTPGGQTGNGVSSEPAISADGRFVAFASAASNLVGNDNNRTRDVFVRDLLLGRTTRVSTTASGVEGNGDSAFPAISANGLHVAFTSLASNLVDGDTNGRRDLFLTSLSGNNEVASQRRLTNATASSLMVGTPAIGSDSQGVLVAFTTGDASQSNVFSTRPGGTAQQVSVNSAEQAGNGKSKNPRMSSDGRFVAFESVATNLVDNDTNGQSDVFVRDRQLGETQRASLGNGNLEANNRSGEPRMSDDGRFIAFVSPATNLVEGAGGTQMMFVRDRQLATTVVASVSSAGNRQFAFAPALSGNGRLAAFTSPNRFADPDTNTLDDVFVHDLAPPVVSYSAGSGLSVVDGAGLAASFTVALSDGTYLVDLGVPWRILIGQGCVLQGATASCSMTGAPLVNVQLGEGNDKLNPGGCGVSGSITADGGTQNDRLTGGGDIDLLRGGDGIDTLHGCDGNDTLEGGAGFGDIVSGGPGADVLSGGDGGSDTVTYEDISAPVSVTLDDVPTDGAVGEGDNVKPDIEKIFGGAGGDSLTGSSVANIISGRAGNDTITGGNETSTFDYQSNPTATCSPGTCDTLNGNEGDDSLFGQGGSDVLRGDLGLDRLDGGSGNDRLETRDGVADPRINCGDGIDVVQPDLVDSFDSNCELLDQGAVREGPHIVFGVKRPVTLRRGALSVPLTCPRALRHACTGTLVVANTQRGLRTARKTRYRVPSGKRRVVRARVGAGIRRGTTVYVQSVEKGDTRGLKTTRRLARIARR